MSLINFNHADKEIDTVPTVGFNAPVRIERQGKTLCFYDLGGGARIRGVWTKYFHEVRFDMDTERLCM